MNYVFNDFNGVEMQDEKGMLCFIEYTINNSTLHIVNIERTCLSRYRYSYDYHFGTNILNALLLHLYQKDVMINRITGILSYFDTVNNNWHDSIPFYADFSIYLDKRLPYKLRFHLFADASYTNEVDIPSDWNERNTFIKSFTESHNKALASASFCYDVLL